MGVIRYVLPIGIFAIAVKVACINDEYMTSKLLQGAIFLISIAVLMSTFQMASGELTSSKELGEIVKDAYSIGATGKGGGALGAILAVPLVKLLGEVGAIILCIGIAAMLLVFTFGINLSEMIQNMVEKSKDRTQERREQRQKDHEEGLKTKQSLKEEKRKLKMEKELAFQKVREEVKDPEEQIKINFGGRIVDTEDTKGVKKYDHSQDDLVPLTKQTKRQLLEKKEEEKEEIIPDVIENNLFKVEEEKKEDKTKAVLQLEHAMIVEDENYEYPPLEILGKPAKKSLKGGAKALTDTATRLQKTLYSFGVSAKVENVSVGPAITRYELKPAEGVRVSKIANLADDIALNLAAETIRIEAPIPGKQAVGIEVPNKEKEAVHLREVLESEDFQESKSKLTVALGKDVARKYPISGYFKNASCFNCRIYWIWKKCMYQYHYYKYYLPCQTKRSKTSYGRSKGSRTFCL